MSEANIMNATDINEIAKEWSSGVSFYSNSILLNNTTPSDIFKTAFSDRSSTFFNDLNQSKWIDKPLNSEFIGIKQKMFVVKANEYGLPSTNITQTAYFRADDSFIIYSVAQSVNTSDHMVIDQWTIKCIDNKVLISLNAKIILRKCKSRIAIVIKSKWLRFYQNGFDIWKKRIKQSVSIAPYIGTWSILNTFAPNHIIKITVDRIEYLDGSYRDMSFDGNEIKITSIDNKSKYVGHAIGKNKIKWNDGTVWIKGNCFKRFDGEYKHNLTEQTYIISANDGSITLPITNKKVQIMLIDRNTISFSLSKHMEILGTLPADNQNTLTLDNESVWIKQNNEGIVDDEIIQNGEEKDDEGTVDTKNVGLFENVEVIEHDLCDEFNLECSESPKLAISDNEHFIVVNNEMFNNQQKENGDWELI